MTLRDRHRLERRRHRSGARWDAEVAAARVRYESRLAAVPQVAYPPELPVSERRSEILEAIRDHQVVVVAGETGSGKTTQIPKICLELGRGVTGTIGHTQPRRIAARTVAERIAEELDTPLGAVVGYAVRFDDRVGDTTLVKVMTDGILLAEIPRDPLLTSYDTIIIDEAHERSLNIDFLLGYLRTLLPRRPDLKVVVTSATIDTARFADHFGDAPVVEVSGRTYPVEIRYEPVVDDADDRDRDQTEAVVDAVRALLAEGDGDVLVFLSGEREIRDTADALTRAELRHAGSGVAILPLYARLSAADQHRVFRPGRGRRVVLATNVAETSITVPGIRAVVDAGTARISRFNARTKVQRLPIEPISQASANQRAGRCGRLGPGVCVRLYSEEDFDGRPAFTDPEIVRTNLASVILRMASLGLGDVAAFPFVDPPDRRQVTAGLLLLDELGALRRDGDAGGQERHPDDRGPRLTHLGRRLAALPIDPRFARMLLEAETNAALREVTVIAAALSIQDPRERPSEARQAADEAHRRFAESDSDFLAYLRLWEHVREQQRAGSGSQFRRLCRREFLNFQRIREWQDLVTQLRQVGRDLGLAPNKEPAPPDAIHRSLLAGLLSQIGRRADEPPRPVRRPRRTAARPRPGREFQGARGTRFALGRDSALAKASPRWVMAAELVETNRLWARTAARVDPAWVERLADHLVERSYSEPHWDAERAGTVAIERVTLYGVPIVEGRKVDYGRFDPALAHDLFVRHALVEGDWQTHHRFVAANQRAAEAVRALEDRVRRRDLLVDDDALFDLYEQRVPPDVVSGRHFDRWYRRAAQTDPDVLTFAPSALVAPGAGRIRFDDWPDGWRRDGIDLRLAYVYDPGADDDGVSVHLPLALLNQVGDDGWDWQIPGLRTDLVAAILRSLPKELRRQIHPVADAAARFVAEATPADGPLLEVLASWTARRIGAPVSSAWWDLGAIPSHLRLTFVVEDRQGRLLATGKDLGAIRRRLLAALRRAVASATSSVERSGIRSWDFATLPRVVESGIGGHVVRGFPALVDEGDSVGIRVLTDETDQATTMWAGTRRLLALTVVPPVARSARRLPDDAKLALGSVPHASVPAFLDDAALAAVDRLLTDAGGPVWDGAAWDRLIDASRRGAPDAADRVVRRAALVLVWASVVRRRLQPLVASVLGPSVADLRVQLERLVGPGFVTRTGTRRLVDVVRYLKAAERRIDLLAADPLRDRERMRAVRRLEDRLDLLTVGPGRRGWTGREPTGTGTDVWTGRPEADDVRWMLEELRVSIWAQSLGTGGPVSEARVQRAIDRLRP